MSAAPGQGDTADTPRPLEQPAPARCDARTVSEIDREIRALSLEDRLHRLASLRDVVPHGASEEELEEVAAVRVALLKAEGREQPPNNHLAYFYLQTMLLRFYRARGRTVERAVRSLQRTMRWFDSTLLDMLRLHESEDRKEHKALFRQFDAEGVLGVDKRGAPVTYVLVGCRDTDGITRELGEDVHLRCIANKVELGALLFSEVAARSGTGFIGGTGVFDCAGLEWQRAVDFISMMVKTSEFMLTEHYPDITYVIYIVNTPWFFNMGWSLLLPFLPVNTRRKIKVCSYVSELQDIIDIEEIPSFLGGRLALPWPHGAGGSVPEGLGSRVRSALQESSPGILRESDYGGVPADYDSFDASTFFLLRFVVVPGVFAYGLPFLLRRLQLSRAMSRALSLLCGVTITMAVMLATPKRSRTFCRWFSKRRQSGSQLLVACAAFPFRRLYGFLRSMFFVLAEIVFLWLVRTSRARQAGQAGRAKSAEPMSSRPTTGVTAVREEATACSAQLLLLPEDGVKDADLGLPIVPNGAGAPRKEGGATRLKPRINGHAAHGQETLPDAPVRLSPEPSAFKRRPTAARFEVFPPPVFHCGGVLASATDLDHVAVLPEPPLTLTARLRTAASEFLQVVLAWRSDGDVHGCVELRLQPGGNLEYGEHDGITWRSVAVSPAVNLSDSCWHTVSVGRSVSGEVHIFLDNWPVSRGTIPAAFPAGLSVGAKLWPTRLHEGFMGHLCGCQVDPVLIHDVQLTSSQIIILHSFPEATWQMAERVRLGTTLWQHRVKPPTGFSTGCDSLCLPELSDSI